MMNDGSKKSSYSHSNGQDGNCVGARSVLEPSQVFMNVSTSEGATLLRTATRG